MTGKRDHGCGIHGYSLASFSFLLTGQSICIQEDKTVVFVVCIYIYIYSGVSGVTGKGFDLETDI